MDHIGLFEGIGGFSLAASRMGWRTIAWCEINPFCQRILKYYWPNASKHEDITKTDFSIYRGRVDVLTGGFPCQPYSTAGKRLGKEDTRHLWPEMLRSIQEIRPRWIVGENVAGLINWSGVMVFEEVQVDLENEGYEVLAFILPAVGVNAPHRRDRVWFIAKDSMCDGRLLRELVEEGSGLRELRNSGAGSSDRVYLSKRVDAYADERTKESSVESTEVTGNGSANNDEQESRGEQAEQHTRRGDVLQYASNTNNKRQEQQSRDSFSNQQRQSSWIFKARGFDNFPTQSPICSGDDGLPRELDGITFSKWRIESIRSYGNAIVPQVALQIFKAIEQYEAY